MGFTNANSSKSMSTSDNKLNAVQIQQSTYGMVIPVGYGTFRIAGNVIDYIDFSANGTTTSVGGKGMQSQSNTTYSYSVRLIIGICQGPIKNIFKVWESKTETNLADIGMSYFSGTSTQTAWGEMKTYHSERALNYRQLAYAAGNVSLGDSASVPNYNFEVSGSFGGEVGNGTITESFNFSENTVTNASKCLLVYTNYFISLISIEVDYFTTNGTYANATNYSYYTFDATNKIYYVNLSRLSCTTATVKITYNSTNQLDANPALVVYDLLTNPVYGAGFPSDYIGDLTNFSNYCVANGIRISPIYTDQQETHQILTDISSVCNSNFVWSQGKLFLVPAGDTAITGNGVTWNPNLTPIYDLGNDDFLTGDNPINCTRSTQVDTYNFAQLEYLDRNNNYNIEIADAKDRANQEIYGIRPAPVISAHIICDSGIAKRTVQLYLDRVVAFRNHYVFKTSIKYILLDLMDLVTITDSDSEIDHELVRIISIKESEDDELEFEVEEVPVGCSTPAIYAQQSRIPTLINYNVNVGNVNPAILFEPPFELTDGSLEVWAGASSSNPNFGGTEVWISEDDETYKKAGTIKGGCRQGTLISNLPLSLTDIDTTNTLSVDLTMSNGELLSGTQSDADNLNTLCYVDGELLAYETATLTDINKYNLTYLNRNAYNTGKDQHLSGSQFARIDKNVFLGVTFNQNDIGKLLYVKFLSYNIFGSGYQSLADVYPYMYTIQGNALKQDPENVQNLTTYYKDGYIYLKWNPVEDTRSLMYEVRKGEDWDLSVVIGRFITNEILSSGDGTYLVKAYVPEYGLYSENYIAIDVEGSRVVNNVIASWDERNTGWAGVQKEKLLTTIKNNVSDPNNIKGLYVFDQISGTTIPDLSGRGNNLITSNDISFLNPTQKTIDLGKGIGNLWYTCPPITSNVAFNGMCLLQNGDWLVTDYSYGYIYRSTDKGKTWTKGALIESGSSLRAIKQLQNGTIVILSGTAKAYKSTDNGVTFDNGSAIPSASSYCLYQLKNGTVILYNSYSTDNCNTYTTRSQGFRDATQQSDGTVVATDGGDILYKSVDNGITWSMLKNLNSAFGFTGQRNIIALQDDTILVSNGSSSIRLSADGQTNLGITSSIFSTPGTFMMDSGKLYVPQGTGYLQAVSQWSIPDNDDMSFVQYGTQELVTDGSFEPKGYGPELVPNGDFDTFTNLGSELITNGSFTNDVSGWSTSNSATISSVTNGQIGNCLQVTNGASYGYAYQAIPTVIGKTYQISYYHKSTNASCYMGVGTAGAGTTLGIIIHQPTDDTSWTKYTLQFTATTTTSYISFVINSAIIGNTALFDEVSCKQNLNLGTELVTNGSFTTDTSGWSPYLSNLSVVSSGQNGNCLQVSYISAGATAYQAIPTTIGKTYKLTTYCKDGTTRGYPAIADSSWNYYPVSNQGQSNPNWTQYTATFIAKTSSTNLQLWCNSSGTALFDEVSIKEDLLYGPELIQNNGFENLGYGSELMGNGTFDNTATYGSELITNGGFTSDTSGWTLLGTNITSVSGGQNGNCLKMQNNPTQCSIYQTFTTVVGRTYEVNFYAKNGTIGAQFWLGSSARAYDYYNGRPNNASWTKYTYLFTAASTLSSVEFNTNSTTDQDNTYIDEVSVKERTDITSSWTGGNHGQLSIVSGGQNGNCLQLSNFDTNPAVACQSFPTVVGKTYELNFYHKNGTAGGYALIGTSFQGAQILSSVGYSASTFTLRTLTFVATSTTTYISFVTNGTTAGNYTYFDGISCKQNLNYNTEIISNGNFTVDASSWGVAGGGATTLASVSGGVTGNCLQVTRTTTGSVFAYQGVSLVVGKTYNLSLYCKLGTATLGTIGVLDSSWGWIKSQAITNSSWTLQTITFTATTTTTYIELIVADTTVNATMLFDSVSLREDLTVQNWLGGNSAILTTTSGGQLGNCLQLANGAANYGYTTQAITTVVGNLYELNFWYKSGTSTSGGFYIGTTYGGYEIANQNCYGSSWTKYSTVFAATSTTTYLTFTTGTNVSGNTVFYDEISIRNNLYLNGISLSGGGLASIVSGGQSGNCLQLTNGKSATQGHAYLTMATTIGHTYTLSFYSKNTSAYVYLNIGSTAGTGNNYSVALNNTTWTLNTVNFSAVATTTYIDFSVGSTALNNSILIDQISLKENLTFSNWNGGWLSSLPYSITGEQSGNCLQLVNGAAYGSYIVQAITTVVGQGYELNMYHKNGTGNGYVCIGTSFGGVELLSATISDTNWTKKTYTFRATSTTTYIRIGNGTSTLGVYTYYDEVSLKTANNQPFSVIWNGITDPTCYLINKPNEYRLYLESTMATFYSSPNNGGHFGSEGTVNDTNHTFVTTNAGGLDDSRIYKDGTRIDSNANGNFDILSNTSSNLGNGTTRQLLSFIMIIKEALTQAQVTNITNAINEYLSTVNSSYNIYVNNGTLRLIDTTKTGYYELPISHITDIGTAQLCYVSTNYSLTGDVLHGDMDSIPDMDAVANIDGNYSNFVSNSKLQIATAGNDGVFSDWQDLNQAQYFGRKFKSRVVLSTSNNTITPVLETFIFIVDVPDLNQKDTITVPANGANVVYPIAYQNAQNNPSGLQITILNKQAGDTEVVTTPTNTGFTIQVLNNGVGVSRTISWFAQGY